MTKLQIFDPPMCCTSGVCGTNVDTKLVKLLNDIEWLKSKGVEIERFGLAFEPQAFVDNELVKETLQKDGNDCLPLILVDSEIVFKGGYPDRAKLAEFCNVEFEESTAQKDESVPVECCGPDCDCHKTSVGNKFKTAVLITILLLIAIILAVKFSCKAGATETKSQIVGSYMNSLSKRPDAGYNASFVYIPSKNNSSIDAKTKAAIISAQKTLKAKNIKTNLYTLNPKSSDYASISSKTKLPAVLVVGRGCESSILSGNITTTGLLQAYMQASQFGCGASCPCHRK